ncbi:MAG: YciI family protein [Hyphococcus sp.]
MPTFILICRDREDGFELRAQTRQAHLEYIKAQGGQTRFAGPMLDDEERPIGSVLVIEADDVKAAERFAQADPYARAGLFESVEINPFRIVIGARQDGNANSG